MANQYGNLGIIYRERGELEWAEKMYRKALAIAENLGRQEGMADNCVNLGMVYAMRGDPPSFGACGRGPATCTRKSECRTW